MSKHIMRSVPVFIILVGLLCSGTVSALDLQPSVFDTEQLRIKYNASELESDDYSIFAPSDSNSTGNVKRKSPAKAFFLSLLIPGAGQLYNGNKIKPVAFLGVEIASWLMYSNWHGDGDDLTAQFEAFHQEHWLRERYEQKYLLWVFGETDDDNINALGITHHLPDEPTQQYYEMTGKYDQFAWGWDDAELNGKTIDSFSISNPMPAITGKETTPHSRNREEIYEPMRYEADQKYKKATRMIYVSIANHLISAFEAYIMSKKHNRAIDESQEATFLSRVKVRSSLRSFNARKDTPFITVTWKF